MSYQKQVIGDCELYLADCMDVIYEFSQIGFRCDALVTDPPYGIGEGGRSGSSERRSNKANANKYAAFDWDVETADQELDQARGLCDHQVIFGGNYYHLPPTKCWLVWNKLNTGDFADCELAWTNLNKAVRKIDYLWNGMIRMEKHIERVHPTQKPVGVMAFCLDQLPESVDIVFDPFMGSGTTGVACVERGKKFIGVEKNQEYFDYACSRIEAAYQQRTLF
jgi:DNA modification methylase